MSVDKGLYISGSSTMSGGDHLKNPTLNVSIVYGQPNSNMMAEHLLGQDGQSLVIDVERAYSLRTYSHMPDKVFIARTLPVDETRRNQRLMEKQDVYQWTEFALSLELRNLVEEQIPVAQRQIQAYLEAGKVEWNAAMQRAGVTQEEHQLLLDKYSTALKMTEYHEGQDVASPKEELDAFYAKIHPHIDVTALPALDLTPLSGLDGILAEVDRIEDSS